VPRSYEGIAGWRMSGKQLRGLATLPQVMLQRVSSFKPQPNGKTISIKESKLTSRDGTLVRLAESGIPNCGIRSGSYVRYARQSVDGARPHPGRRSRRGRSGEPNERVYQGGGDPAEAKKGISDAVVPS
jgi:hypothetical protein